MARVAETEHALLGAALFLVAAGTADGGIVTARIERLTQTLGLHHVGVYAGAVADRADALRQPERIDVDLQLDAVARRHRIAKRVHLAEFPAGVDVQQRDRRWRRKKRLAQQMQQHRAVLADRVQHHRLAEFRRHLAQDVDALGFEAVEMGKRMSDHGSLTGFDG